MPWVMGAFWAFGQTVAIVWLFRYTNPAFINVTFFTLWALNTWHLARKRGVKRRARQAAVQAAQDARNQAVYEMTRNMPTTVGENDT
jgi:hypothetical protein